MIKNEFIYPLRVHIEDTDYSGVVFHANYLKFMERARSEWGEQIGFGMDWQNKNKIYLVVAAAEIKFIRPAKLHEQVEVVSTIKSMRPASFVYDQHLRLADAKDTILCKAQIKLACVNEEMRPCGFPDTPIISELRRLFS